MKQRVRTLTHEIRDVDFGPRPANLFATGPTGGDPVIGGEIARPGRTPTDEQRERWAAEKRTARARRAGSAAA